MYRDTLLWLTTYPEPTPVSAVERAVALADAFGARISAIACEVLIKPPGRFDFISRALIDIPGLVAAELRKSADNARDLLAAFDSAAQRAGNLQEKIVQRCGPAEVPDVVVQYARMRDLTIVPVPEGDFIDQWYAETVIFESGHPTLILPHATPPADAPVLDTVAVAWDFSRPAARAVWDALPILRKAKSVRVVTVSGEKEIRSSHSAEELAKYLSGHGITVVLDLEEAKGRPIGEVLESYVAAHHAGLLVMGAYGHSKLRQFVLGGATKSMLWHPPVPILLSH